MFYFSAYGINFYSNLYIPGLQPFSNENSLSIPPITLLMGYLPSWFYNTYDNASHVSWYTSSDTEDGRPTLQVWDVNSGKYYYFRYGDGIEFVVDRLGTEIWANWPENLTLEDAATYLLGPILGFIQRIRNIVCLHASAIAISGRAVVLVGNPGSGKSTTAAAFAQQGYAILSDDVVPLVDHDGIFLIQPAYPRIRLWDSSVFALFGSANALPRLVPTHPTWNKRYLDLNQWGYNFQQKPLPLAAIYYLNLRSDNPLCPYIEPMPVQEQLMTLIANTYTNYLLSKDLRAKEFELLGRLVECIPVRQITPSTNLEHLPQLIKIILQDFCEVLTQSSLAFHA